MSVARSRGFTLLELVVVISIIGILGIVAVDRLMYVREQAEKTVMEQTASILRSAMRLQMADLISRQEAAKIATLAGQNPMNWLAEKPSNYLGEFRGPPPAAPRGSWYFDLNDDTLVYLVEHGDHFIADPQGRKRVRYRAVAVTAEPGPAKEGAASAVMQQVEGIRLALMEPYTWF
jgi:prepilin-type N-terminal cleavage/methylation domain-containing protein